MSTVHPGYNSSAIPASRPGDPAWEVAYLFPAQGRWRESQYLCLDRSGGRIVELVDGELKVPPMPTIVHQLIAKFLLWRLDSFVTSGRLGVVLPAPLPVHIGPDHYREPDIVFFRPTRIPVGKEYPESADLVIEIVSDDAESRKRDYEEKRRDYAAAGIPEYWIVDPQDETISVLTLDGAEYRVHGKFAKGDVAKSVLLDGFSIDVAEMYAAAKLPQ
jgi:Uma2 family endonuclease